MGVSDSPKPASPGSLLIGVSASETETRRLLANGPRRDFLELAAASGGEVVYRAEARRARGRLGRIAGPHIRQAWELARRAQPDDVVFVDGEHIGIPLLFFLAALRRAPKRVVFLGHVLWLWKRALLWVATRISGRGVLVVHSVHQAELARSWIGSNWEVRALPYQVDTDFWRPLPERPPDDPPLIVAVGSEYRDYDVLLRAVEGQPLRLIVAAGSHWARFQSRTGAIPDNVEFLTEPLPFAELRELYQRAAAVIVPLQEMPNQAGVTTILEAMSMGLPVVVTATEGQLECVGGPLVRPDGGLDRGATADRGPARFGAGVIGAEPSNDDSGLYVPADDAAALRAAIAMLIADRDLARSLGKAGRATAVAHFSVDQYAERVGSLLGHDGSKTAALAEREARR